MEGHEIIADSGQNNCCSNGVLNLNVTFNCLYKMVLNKYHNNHISRPIKIIQQSEIMKKIAFETS